MMETILKSKNKIIREKYLFMIGKWKIFCTIWKIIIQSFNFLEYHGESERIVSIEEFLKTILFLFNHLKKVSIRKNWNLQRLS
ncbi:hypothetical protein DW679_10240 [Lachnospiraceae bacterium AM25-27]|nr:hypothetical protein DW679_10240 [Lachnospiraceae bacterium AM25-27]